jgi:hypothetical protein
MKDKCPVDFEMVDWNIAGEGYLVLGIDRK